MENRNLTTRFGQKEQKEADKLKHEVKLYQRKTGCLTGVLDVFSFDEDCLILETDAGLLHLEGKGLHVTRLSLESGEVDFEGTILLLKYQEKGSYKKAGESFWKRLWQ